MNPLARLFGNGRSRFRPVVPERPLDAAAVTSFRAGAFPDAGPRPWLDRTDAAEAIEAKRARGELTAAEAAFARAWLRDGVVTIPAFVEEQRLDAAFAAYERALAEAA